MIALSVDDTEVAVLHFGETLPTTLSPRPYLHPLRTLSGSPVTGFSPRDHPHHLGLSVGIPLVDDTNFWGGPTYLPQEGYVWRDDHGRQRVDRCGSAPDRVSLGLSWLDKAGAVLLDEERDIEVLPGRARGDAWRLRHRSVLRNPGREAVTLSGPGARGRAGAGYGGVFWRGPAEATVAEAQSPTARGENALNGRHAPFLVVRSGVADGGGTWTLGLRDLAATPEPWFLRLEEYVGAGPALVGSRPRVLAPGEELPCGLAIVVADGALSLAQVQDELLELGGPDPYRAPGGAPQGGA
ncbi:DUF6807 family protein [Pedococcus sp. 5OH_020]|uniref:DUF6807 family protein n=1 Tax=Pedococcus sp. 5OH_020 TaxID=2989814 RepID=UPI0022E9C443|nr:DUF6807 family protein [Pedococcus sp. 5OH_020]